MAAPRDDLYWMNRALDQARQAGLRDEAPVGAVVVCAGRLVGRGFNLRETRQDVTLHAEIMAIRQACRRLGSWRLDACDLYVTLEPCLMCAGAIIQARIRTLYYGAADPKAGACGSVLNALAIPFNHPVTVCGGLLAEESAHLLHTFFRQRRKFDKAAGTRRERRAAAGGPPSADR
jgi:tRNA(adenine34) deaminase